MTDDFRRTPQMRLANRLNGRAGKFAWLGLKAMGVEIPLTVKIGRQLRLAHGAVGLVVHQHTVIGRDVTLYQGVTLGRGDQYLLRAEVPDGPESGGQIIVGDRVIIGANAVVLFKVGQRLTLGDDCIIGANSTVLDSVPQREIWAGSPAAKVGMNTRSHDYPLGL